MESDFTNEKITNFRAILSGLNSITHNHLYYKQVELILQQMKG